MTDGATELCLIEGKQPGTYPNDLVQRSSRRTSDTSVYDDDENHAKCRESQNLHVGDDLEIHENKVVKGIVTIFSKIGVFYKKNSSIIETFVIVLLVIFYICYMIVALVIDFDRAIALLVIFCLVLFYKIYAYLRDHCGDRIWTIGNPAHHAITKNMNFLKWSGIALVFISFAVFIALDVAKRPQRLIPIAGYVIFVFFLWVVGSKYPEKVRWRPVFWGLGIQIVVAALILRVEAVFEFFNWLGLFTQNLLDYVTDGSIMVFGKLYYQHFVAFKVLPMVIYFSSFISVMYYLGAMQWLIYRIAWLMQFTLGTSGTESMCAAGNIFVGQTESPLLILPYLKDVTTSELFAIMTSGFGTIAGSVVGAYLEFGIKAVYIITACVMAAPCALALAKLMYPETKVSKFRKLEGLALDPPDQKNIIQAAFVGASNAIPLVVNIAANLIAFIALLAALNGFLSWYGGLVGYPQLGFETICSYVFIPVTYMMGIEWEDCFKCAELLGTKIFLNEFIAYQELSRMIDNKKNGTYQKFDDDGTTNWINDRSEAIITYALCGFANIGAIGVQLGGLGALCPERQKEMAKIIVRAWIAGIFVSVLNACTAGFFYLPNPDCTQIYNSLSWDGTVEISSLYGCCEDVVTSLNSSCLEYQRCCNYTWEDTSYALIKCS